MSNFRFLLSRGGGALALCLFFVTPISSFGETAGKAVASFLRQNGLREGYDATRGRLITIGIAARDIPDANAQDIFRIRDEMVLEAVMAARVEIIKAVFEESIAINVKYFEEANSKSENGDEDFFTPFNKAQTDIQSRWIIYGCTILRTEESYNKKNKEYEIAIAAVFDARRQQAALDAISGKGTISTPEADATALSTFAAKTDFAHRFGPLQFIDNNGKYHFVGTGFVDVEGKSKEECRKASKEAELEAEKSLACALWSERIAFEFAKKCFSDKPGPNWGSTSFSTDFAVKVHKAGMPPDRHRIVFEGDVVRPLTGRKTHVCVLGIDSVDVAKLGILVKPIQ